MQTKSKIFSLSIASVISLGCFLDLRAEDENTESSSISITSEENSESSSISITSEEKTEINTIHPSTEENSEISYINSCSEDNTESSTISSSSEEKSVSSCFSPCPRSCYLIEAKAGYFFPTGSKFREIYGGSGIYGVEISRRIRNGLYVWGSGSYFGKSGHSEGLHKSTHLTMVPLGIGVKGFYRYKQFDFYVGIGGLLTFVYTHDHSHYVRHHKFSVGGGGIVKGGFIVDLPSSFFLDFYGDYSLMAVPSMQSHRRVESEGANMSGGSVGIGLGYKF